MTTLPILLLLTLLLSQLTMASDSASSCPDSLNHSFRQLHGSETINLCNLYSGGPVLLVNTASYCGFTPQLKALEKLHQQYQTAGLVIVGFSSNDFNQEAKDEKKAAKICYYNYGVTFTMLAPTHVKGSNANPLFTHLAKVTGKPPAWNFNKYLVASNGENITHYPSTEQPLGSTLEKDIRALLRK